MSWKRCGGCTRAIPEAVVACTYCGHTDDKTLSLTDFDLDRQAPSDDVSEVASVDLAMNQVELPLTAESVPVEPAPSAPAPAPAAATARVAATAPAGTPAPATTAPAATVPATSATPVAAKATPGLKGRNVATIGIVLLAGAALIFMFFGTRGSASPDPAPAPAKPTKSTKSTTKPTPAAAPAARAGGSSAAAAVAAAPRWSRAADGRWIPASPKNLAFEVSAANKVHIWTRDVTPVLIVRCQAGTMDVFVFTDSAARMEPQDQDHTVRLTIDDGRERIERWPDSETHDALFARDGAAFAKELEAAESLRFGYTPHNAEPVVATFNVSGLAEQLATAARQCTPRSELKAGPRTRAKRAEPSE